MPSKKPREITAYAEVNCYGAKHKVRVTGTSLVLIHHPDLTFAQFMRTFDLMGQPQECGCGHFARRLQSALKTEYPGQAFYLSEVVRPQTQDYNNLAHILDDLADRKRLRQRNARIGKDDPMLSTEGRLKNKRDARRLQRTREALSQWEHVSKLSNYHPEFDSNLAKPLTVRLSRAERQCPYLHLRVNPQMFGERLFGQARYLDNENHLILGKQVQTRDGRPVAVFKVLAFFADKDTPWGIGYRTRGFALQDGEVILQDNGAPVLKWEPIHKLVPLTQKALDFEGVYP